MLDFSKITTFIFDVDGVLSDGTVIAYANGEQPRSFLVKDGYAVEKAVQKGFHVAIISGGFQEGVRKRLEFLGVKHIFLGVKDKIAVFNNFLAENNIEASQVLYMGDDLPDYDVMQLVGIATCPADSTQEIIDISHYVSPKDGGKGAVRDVIEKVMKSQNKWVISNNHANG
jgi:3-deoxy-D-manno-octulosonate 8-phosphate phosphatase (KDO 8-P phosphatase)